MKCAKSKVSCEGCEKHDVCPIYREYMIASSIPFVPLISSEFPHGDEWIGWEHDNITRRESN